MDKEIKEMFDKVFEKTDILLRRVEKIESGFKEDNKVEEPEAQIDLFEKNHTNKGSTK